MTQEYYKPLDALRGLLALAVVFYHVQWGGLIATNGFIQNGYLAVDAFFCLSGFLMFTLYRSISSGNEARSFMIKRFARLYPLHLFTLLAMLLYLFTRLMAHKAGLPILEPGESVPLSDSTSDNLSTFISNLVLTQSLGAHDGLSFNKPSWSISVEFYTYIVFALIMIFLPLKKLWHYCVVAAVTALIYLGLSLIRPNLDITHDLGFLRCLGGFGAGITAAVLFQTTRAFYTSQSKLSASFIEVCTLLVFLYWFSTAEGTTTFFAAPFMILLIITFANDKGLLSTVMNMRIFQYLGKVSYSVYLNHSLVIIVINLFISQFLGGLESLSPLTGDIISLIYLAIVLVSSNITYHVIEKPSAKFLRKRLLKQKRGYTKRTTQILAALKA